LFIARKSRGPRGGRRGNKNETNGKKEGGCPLNIKGEK